MNIDREFRSILALSFKESYVGRHFGQTKMKSEYSILFDYVIDVTVEITTSRISRKKTIKIDGELVEQFKRVSTSDLRHSWTYPIGDGVAIFSICPNINGSASDLLINGKDFFSYVYSLDQEYPLGVSKSAYDVHMLFTIPVDRNLNKIQSHRAEASKPAAKQDDFSMAPELSLPSSKLQLPEQTTNSNEYLNLEDEDEAGTPIHN